MRHSDKPMQAKQILGKYISFFEKRGHKRIENSSLVPVNDPTTLFTSSGMQPLVPYLLGESHPEGKRLVNAQNSFRAADIDEVGDNRHTTFFRMLGNWSLGDYFKKEQIPWFFEFLTSELKLDPQKLYVTVFEGDKNIPADTDSVEIWKEQFKKVGIEAEIGTRIFKYGVTKNWWSRSGIPDNMPVGEPGGPDSEVFYDYGTPHDPEFGKECHVNCDCGRYLEIGNSVFMQYIRTEEGFKELPQKNVDFGGGLERLVAVTEEKTDIFETSLFAPIIKAIEEISDKKYSSHKREMRIIADHLTAAVFIASNDVLPSNKEQGYILRRLIRRAIDNIYLLKGKQVEKVVEAIVGSYKDTDSILVEKYEHIKGVILEEEQSYNRALEGGRKVIEKELAKSGKRVGDELLGQVEIPAGLAFKAITSFGLGPTQLKSLGYIFDEQALAEQIKAHQDLSRKGAEQKFKGGLADHSEKTIMGHTATHLMHQALRDMFGTQLHQTGSNITAERVRFDFNFDRKLTEEEVNTLEKTVNEKIQENLPVHFEIMPIEQAKEMGAIGLFDEKYAKDVKVYIMGDYSKELCGGPHVNFTGEVKRFTIIKQESLGKGQQRIYANVG
ncbi:MAG: alanine--tRNA ligase [Candidatus Levyibacteriota bacterium]